MQWMPGALRALFRPAPGALDREELRAVAAEIDARAEQVRGSIPESDMTGTIRIVAGHFHQ
jgi:hypothetical protein